MLSGKDVYQSTWFRVFYKKICCLKTAVSVDNDFCCFFFCSVWGSLKFRFRPTVVYHCYECCNWECEGLFSLGITYANNLVLCGESVER